MAERSFAALGDASKAFYLQETIKIADDYEKEHSVDGKIKSYMVELENLIKMNKIDGL